MNWIKQPNEADESILRSDVDSFENDTAAFMHVKEGLALIFERLLPHKPSEDAAIVFIIHATNAYLVVSWYDPKSISYAGKQPFFLELPGLSAFCNHHKDGSFHYDYLCRLGVSSFCREHINPIRPKVKVYAKNDLQTRPTLLKY